MSEPRQPSGERYDFVGLCLAEPASLEAALRMGVQPDMASMAGWEWKGFTPLQLTALVGIAKFKKGFYREDPGRDPALGICGYNVVCHANSLGEPWIDRTRRGRPLRHGWFDVYPVSLAERDNRYPNALMLDYGTSPRSFALDPERALRDYLVQVYADTPDLLLGKAYAAVGGARVFLSYFVLERHNEGSVS
jgi:hypothetical protein